MRRKIQVTLALDTETLVPCDGREVKGGVKQIVYAYTPDPGVVNASFELTRRRFGQPRGTGVLFAVYPEDEIDWSQAWPLQKRYTFTHGGREYLIFAHETVEWSEDR